MDSKIIYTWLKNEWKISNHAKYQKYFETWFNNLTESQINGFDNMRKSNNINKL